MTSFSSSLTLAEQTHSDTRESDYSSHPYFLSSPSLSFSTSLTFNHGRWSQAQQSRQHHLCQKPHSPTAFGVNYIRGSASVRGPTAGDQRQWRPKANDRDSNTLTTSNSLRVRCFQAGDSGKIWSTTNPYLRTHILACELRAHARVHFRHLGD